MQIAPSIQKSIQNYLNGTASPEEIIQVNEWYYSFMDEEVVIDSDEKNIEKIIAFRIKEKLAETLKNENFIEPTSKKRWLIPSVAAAILLIISTSIYLFLNKQSNSEIAKKQTHVNQIKNDIAPGGNKAILTLANGSKIILDSATNGIISEQGNIKIQKLNNGLLAYTVNGKQIIENNEAFYNTISTPRGGQYQITLADGTKVWLNAASSIRFPVLFKGTDRKVEITGEVYFEVTKNKAMPFKVKAASSEVEVLGTHFNVNAYSDEASIKTTLLEGLVKVSTPTLANQVPKFLQPGQQSNINKEGKISVLENADIEETMAWKNGYFQFNSSNLKTILRQISRWYDVDVVFKENVNVHFTGQLTRNQNVSKVFKQLSLTNEVHFKIEGKKIIVLP